MSIFANITSCEHTNAHGEVNFLRVTGGSVDISGFLPCEPVNGGYIVGHSESGHNHILEDRDGVAVMERTLDGMKVLYAILENPTKLKQSAGAPHKEQVVEPGEYIITNNQEYDPFSEQARRVAD